MSTITDRVAAGAAYLDEHNPDWWRRINLDRLDLDSPCSCILGQLDGDYYGAIENRGLYGDLDQVRELGFNGLISEMPSLTAAWRELITARRGGAA